MTFQRCHKCISLVFCVWTFLFYLSSAATMSAELVKSTTSFGDAADPYREDCKLIPFLKTLVNRQILYIRNHGTAGDALIEEGTFELFRKLGLTWDVCCEHVSKNTELDVVMY